MEYPILASNINDFLFCPASIFFHNMYEEMPKAVYQSEKQIAGSYYHRNMDMGLVRKNGDIISGEELFSPSYGIVCRLDIYDRENRIIIEKKTRIKEVYEGHIFQIYAQYYALLDNGETPEKIMLHSIMDSKKYEIDIPEKDPEMKEKFESVLSKMRHFTLDDFKQDNILKCKNCIYCNICDRSLND